ncbi:related to solute carrier family 35 member F2 [Cephalotrichum gorgonifer]|uniref:Related to solute carrier family 35 member F2 n=1 Tax=Cephalotrichum gorgonifer TaxID=2041049 RepID=A0AAE8MW08_9PEZI|nr:related to solute carrier family 35 member F2 [Cephalotrichum gorgonifer]
MIQVGDPTKDAGPVLDPVVSETEAGAPDEDDLVRQGLQDLETKPVRWYSYLTTVEFWAVLLLGQLLALCITGTNTFSSLLATAGTNIPSFQVMFTYVLLSLVYTPVALYRMGPREWGRVAVKHGWKYFIFAFLDVQGNYFTVLAYRYTNILSAQLINFWAIVCVVVVSFLLLRVRYRPFQIVGVVVCCGGMGVLLASDHVNGTNGGPGSNMLKGDLFALVGATCYGLSNVFEEFLVSKRPVYEFLSFLGLLGLCIIGVQAAIFDRDSIRDAVWTGPAVGYVVGFTLVLGLFYSLVPVLLRVASAAFYNISLLTANFWGVIIGIHVFGYAIHFMYPIAFVLIVLGLACYFLSGSALGESKKPWLGENQEGGVDGVGTAKRKALRVAKKAQLGGSAV